MRDGNSYRDDVFSTSVRAGKRTYFFDVKATRGNDLFMTITESKRSGMDEHGQLNFEKHKIFLYKEDFEKFLDGLKDAVEHIKKLQETGNYRTSDYENREGSEPFSPRNSSDVNFEDLG